MICNTISNIASIFTCITFFLYLIGRGWALCRRKNIYTERISFENEDTLKDNEVLCGENYINLANEYGATFSVSAQNGIRYLKIFEAKTQVDHHYQVKKGKVLCNKTELRPNEKFYIRAEFADVGTSLIIETLRDDYVKVQFTVADSGKDGRLERTSYKSKITLRSIFYYLCQ